MTSGRQKELASFSVGNEVRIRDGYRSPYAGHQGVIFSVDSKDVRAPYLVRFHDGIQFRYHAEEVEFPQPSEAGHTSEKLMKSGLYRIFAAFLIFAAFILIGCAVPIPSARPHIAVQASFLNNTHPRIYPSGPPGFGTRQ
jgi:hypothetical protein